MKLSGGQRFANYGYTAHDKEASTAEWNKTGHSQGRSPAPASRSDFAPKGAVSTRARINRSLDISSAQNYLDAA